MKQKLLTLLLLMCVSLLHAQTNSVNITPQPQSITERHGYFTIDSRTVISHEGSGMENSVAFLQDYLERFYSIRPSASLHSKETNVIRLSRSVSPLGKEAYRFSAKKTSIEITAAGDTGIFYGIQTLIGLLPAITPGAESKSIKVPAVEINDTPRFGYRGIHLDVARHFFPVDYIKKFLDLLALHKFNRFHWHLTDDQGWRIEINKYPLLTATGSCRDQTLVGRFGSDTYDSTRYCGYYTQDEIREVVEYAAHRYITVIPEIDMPGHTTAALAAYPYLECTKGPYEVSQTWGVHREVMCAGNDSTYEFIKNVLAEVTKLFPSTIIHVGGDEVPKERWKACSACQGRIKKEGLRNESELQSYFMNRVNKMVMNHGRIMAGWDEILEGRGVPGTVIMAWRGKKFSDEALRLGHPVIFTPDVPLYLNFQQSGNEDSVTQGGNNTIEKVYAYDPHPGIDKPPALVMGIQANIWTEYISNPAKLEYMALPRLSAVAEAAWSQPARKDFDRFQAKLPTLIALYKMWGLNFSAAHFGLRHEVVPVGPGAVGWKLQSRTPGDIFYRSDNDTLERKYTEPILIRSSSVVSARLSDTSGALVGSPAEVKFNFNMATGRSVSLAHPPNPMYGGKGGFTLVDGIWNSSGMVKSAQFLGFLGTDLVATIDLGSVKDLKSVTLRAFEQKASWIYAPKGVKVMTSSDGTTFQEIENQPIKTGIKNLTIQVAVKRKARFLRVIAFSHGTIAAGMPGEGRKSWLFADEIIVN